MDVQRLKVKPLIKKAINIYTSPQFRLCLSIAKRLKADITILSSKYGFINPNTIIQPYSNTWQSYPRYLRDLSKEDRHRIEEFNKKSMEYTSKLINKNHPNFSLYSRVIILSPYHNTKKLLLLSNLYNERFEFWFSGALGCFDMKRHLNNIMRVGLKEAQRMNKEIRKGWRKEKK